MAPTKPLSSADLAKAKARYEQRKLTHSQDPYYKRPAPGVGVSAPNDALPKGKNSTAAPKGSTQTRRAPVQQAPMPQPRSSRPHGAIPPGYTPQPPAQPPVYGSGGDYPPNGGGVYPTDGGGYGIPRQAPQGTWGGDFPIPRSTPQRTAPKWYDDQGNGYWNNPVPQGWQPTYQGELPPGWQTSVTGLGGPALWTETPPNMPDWWQYQGPMH